MTFQEIRDRVMSMEPEDCRQELADTLELLGRLEADFEVVCREVAILSYHKPTERFATTRDFDSVMERRGGFPEMP